MRTLISIVTYNSEKYIARCLSSLSEQSLLNREPDKFCILVIDNNSTDRTIPIVKNWIDDNKGKIHIQLQQLSVNLGFSGGHNRSVYFLRFNDQFDSLLVLNPDVRLSLDALEQLESASKKYTDHIITPKLYRADENLQAIEPLQLDAAGMILTEDIRHFDRGSNLPDIYQKEENIFGGTGACLFMSKNIVEKLLLSGPRHDRDAYRVFPSLNFEPEKRLQLFDEGFFAYREDADLCWRANLLNIQTVFIPSVTGYHRREVLPDNRKQLSSVLNGLSVTNRFLLQINNYFFTNSFLSIIRGIFFRNILVIFGVLLTEPKSIQYLGRVFLLAKRALERRKILKSKIHAKIKII